MIDHQFVEVLLVEDDLVDVELTRRALKIGKFPVNLNVVRDGDEAIAYLRHENSYRYVAEPNLIWLDLNLPGMNGREVIAEIKADEQLKHIPIVVLTTSDASEDIFSSYRLGANCYIKKPSSLSEWANLVKILEDFWLNIVKLPVRF